MTDESLIEYPSEFPVKIVGLHNDSLRPDVEKILADAAVEVVGITERPSSEGNYLSLTVTLVVTSREQLDDLYQRFTALEDVRWVL